MVSSHRFVVRIRLITAKQLLQDCFGCGIPVETAIAVASIAFWTSCVPPSHPCGELSFHRQSV